MEKENKLLKFETFEDLKNHKSEDKRSEEQIIKSEKDLEIFIEELQKNRKPNDALKKAYKNYIARMM